MVKLREIVSNREILISNRLLSDVIFFFSLIIIGSHSFLIVKREHLLWKFFLPKFYKAHGIFLSGIPIVRRDRKRVPAVQLYQSRSYCKKYIDVGTVGFGK